MRLILGYQWYASGFAGIERVESIRIRIPDALVRNEATRTRVDIIVPYFVAEIGARFWRQYFARQLVQALVADVRRRFAW